VPYRTDFARAFGLEIRIAAVVFLLIAVTMVVALVLSRRRRRRGRGSSQKAEGNKLELSYLSVLAIVTAFIGTVSLGLNDNETADPPKPALTVKVLAFQWCWQFHYIGQPVTVTGQCRGHSLPTLVLPAGKRVRVEVASSDVIHGFWVPYLRWKIYAYPGHVNSFTVTLQHDGRWIGRCSELCGLYHYRMDFWVRAVPPAQFGQWLRANGGTASAAGTASAVTGR
jgi:cytochrome c oxidase subunit II